MAEAVDGAVVVENVISCDEVTKSLLLLVSGRVHDTSADKFTSLSFSDFMVAWAGAEDAAE